MRAIQHKMPQASNLTVTSETNYEKPGAGEAADEVDDVEQEVDERGEEGCERDELDAALIATPVRPRTGADEGNDAENLSNTHALAS